METERLILDAFREEDREDYFRCITHDRRVLETFVCPYTETPEELNLAPYLTNPSLYAIRLKSTGRLIGIILSFAETEDACEIGYAVGADWWGRGYASEAAGCFVTHCMEERGFRTVYASFFKGNEASRRVMEKCGMRREDAGEKKTAMTYLGVERELVWYAIHRQA